jgi:drug/metabolite transporter (DMT)-like permease
MTVQEFFLLFVSILASVAGQFFLKMGAIKLGKVELDNIINTIFRIVTVPELLAGLFFYGLGSLAYILLLTRVNLSIAAPSFSLVYVLSILLGFFIFKEQIPLTRLIGLISIIGGVLLVVSKK